MLVLCLLYLNPVVSDHCGSFESHYIMSKEELLVGHVDELIYSTDITPNRFCFI